MEIDKKKELYDLNWYRGVVGRLDKFAGELSLRQPAHPYLDKYIARLGRLKSSGSPNLPAKENELVRQEVGKLCGKANAIKFNAY